ncbi:hypothetical protein Hanom_Chr00s000005g01611771 [Helianthus anomalus]
MYPIFYERHNWRHASLASKGSKQDSGSLGKSSGAFRRSFATDKTICCLLALI